MSEKNSKQLFRILMLINGKKLTPKAMQLFEKQNVPLHLQLAAHGTANSDMMDILGLGGIEKDFFITVLPKEPADNLLLNLLDGLELTQKNTGIAFTIPLTGINSLFMNFCNRAYENNPQPQKQKEMSIVSNMKYSVVAVTINHGYSEEVMNAARAAGARGGTVFSNNSIVNEDSKGFFGKDFNEEKETILIITDNEKKHDIMQAISDACGINTKAQGIVFSMPIDTIVGL